MAVSLHEPEPEWGCIAVEDDDGLGRDARAGEQPLQLLAAARACRLSRAGRRTHPRGSLPGCGPRRRRPGSHRPPRVEPRGRRHGRRSRVRRPWRRPVVAELPLIHLPFRVCVSRSRRFPGRGGEKPSAVVSVPTPPGRGRIPEVSSTFPRRYGKVFDEVAAEYDRSRPTYPDQLIDRACRWPDRSGDRVLEIGCGSGQLTRSLVARGLHVTAVEPGKRLRRSPHRSWRAPAEVEFVNTRFEDAELPEQHFRAVFSASAFHWIDPDVSWQKAAARCSGWNARTPAVLRAAGAAQRRDQEALLAALARIAPRSPRTGPPTGILPPPSPERSGVARTSRRCGPGSEATTWRGPRRAACLATCRSPPCRRSSSRPPTSSTPCFARRRSTSASRRTSVEPSRAKASRIYERLGRPIRSSTVAVLVTARRAAD